MDSSCDDVCNSDLELRELKVQVKDLLSKFNINVRISGFFVVINDRV